MKQSTIFTTIRAAMALLLGLATTSMATTTYAEPKEKVYSFCWFDPERPTATGCISEFGKKSCD
jgi:ABC-type glycerol-3-phosphate transport system substrate-binding protein